MGEGGRLADLELAPIEDLVGQDLFLVIRILAVTDGRDIQDGPGRSLVGPPGLARVVVDLLSGEEAGAGRNCS